MNEEKKILKQFGRENHFTVPDGYFDTLTSRIMSNIPDEETKIISIAPKRKTSWIKWTGLVAACMAGTVIGIFALEQTEKTSNNQPYTSSAQAVSTQTGSDYQENYQEEMLDYAMVDYNDVYNYLSGGGY